MKPVALALLSLSALAATPVVQAAPVNVDAGQYVITYDDAFLTGATVSFSSGLLRFDGLMVDATVNFWSGGEPVANYIAFNSYEGRPFPLVLTPKAGFQISGLTETVTGLYALSGSGAAGQQEWGPLAGIGAASYWLHQPSMNMLGLNVSVDGPRTLQDGVVAGGGELLGSGSLDVLAEMQTQGLAPGAIALSAIELGAVAFAPAEGSAAHVRLTGYQLGVQVTAVPEPEVLGLMLAGLGVVGVSMARRRAA